MLNFTVGPVQSSEKILEIGGEQVPYFRTSEFSELMLENERLIKNFAKASSESKAVFITGSGTASMEAAVINTLTQSDKVLVVNGGSFGERFVEILSIHRIPFEQIKLPHGKTLTESDLTPYRNGGFTAFIVNLHETSTGVLYDANLISEFCRKEDLFLIVDAISAFLADDINMESLGIDVLITGSQKALACAPGISIIILSAKALTRINQNDSRCLYLDLKRALKDARRGQTPFTPAVGTLRQIHARLKEIEYGGGAEQEINRTKNLADDFRKKIEGLPFEIIPDKMSNALTALHPLTASAHEIFIILKDNYNIWICPNGGDLKDYAFRVGHIGDLTTDDNTVLISAFKDLKAKGLI